MRFHPPRRSRGVFIASLMLLSFLSGIFFSSNTGGFPSAGLVFGSERTPGTGSDGGPDIRKRVTMLRQRCQELQLPKPTSDCFNKVFNHLFVVDEYQLLFCDVPKCGSTNLKRIAYILSGQSNSSNPEDVKPGSARQAVTYLSDYSQAEIKKRMKHYKKIMFIREPLERVLSAYRDNKAQGAEEIKQPFLDYLERVFKKNVSYLIHTATYNYLCRTCSIEYDFIGSLDTYERDIGHLLEWIDATDVVAVPQRNSTGYTKEETRKLLQKYYKDVPSSMIHRLWNVFRTDYVTFDYPFPHHLIN